MKLRHLFALLTFISACFALAVIPNNAAATSPLPPVTEAVSSHNLIPQSAGSWAAPNSGNPQSVDTPTPVPTATPTATASCPLAWRIVPAADSAPANTLNGVAAIAWNDVWAVGVGGQGGVTLMEHWNGSQWATPVSTPHVGFSEVLDAVSAIASNDVWAVGWYEGSYMGTLTEHWNGTQWTLVLSPNGTGYYNRLKSVSMLASNDVWAAGFQIAPGDVYHTLIEHWDGTAWSVIPSPDVNGNGYLRGISAIAPNDVWAVGTYTETPYTRMMVLHWDGSVWSVSPIPTFTAGGYLQGVEAISANDVWAVGYYAEGPWRTLTLHWNGSAWSQITSPNVGGDQDYLYGVDALASNDMWAVGKYMYGNVSQTIAMHWDGSAWSLVTSPNPDLVTEFHAVGMVLPNDVWAVGSFRAGTSTRALTERYSHLGCGTTTPTTTPASTRTPSTITPSPTQVCALGWGTVPSQSYNGANQLKGVVALSPNDAWTVGTLITGSANGILEHWNGTAWATATFTTYGYASRFDGIATVASNDIWAVGWYQGSLRGTLTEHWNGSQWTQVFSPNGSGYYNELYSVSALASNDVWAAGITQDTGVTHTLIEHWNGSTWSITPSPDINNNGYVRDIEAIAPDNVWAVGDGGILHWDGNVWSQVSAPGIVGLSAISSSSASDVWAVGYSSGHTLTAHWNGSTWSIVPSPNVGSEANYLYGVDALAFNDVWAVGKYISGGLEQTLTMHWDGLVWSIVPSPSPDAGAAYLSVSMLASNYVWAVGYTNVSPSTSTLTVLYSQVGCGTITPTPTGTPPPTYTPTVTPTQCLEDYSYEVSSGNISQGATLLSGSQCGHCVVPLPLPFPFTFYGQTYTTANVASQGNLQFTTTDTSYNSCPPGYPQLGPAILPNWDDFIVTSQPSLCQSRVGRPCGVYTSVSGSAPSRIFNIEWLGLRSGSNTYIINFELRLYETTGVFDFVYGLILPPGIQGTTSSIGIQDGSGRFINYACHVADSTPQGLLIRWTPVHCEPTSTPIPTSTRTSTPTATPTQCVENYTYAVAPSNFAIGTTLLAGTQCGGCVVPLPLPFPFTFYGQTYTTANVSTKGNVQFTTMDTSTNSCPPGYPQLGPSILPNWDDFIDTSQISICQSLAGRPCGVYTSVVGGAPNRALNIEWLGRRSGSSTYIINFELRLYEGTGVFDFAYGLIRPPGVQGSTSSIGIQDGLGRFINYACHVVDSTYQGLLIQWIPTGCGATPTPTLMPTSTSTPTASPTATIGPPCGVIPNFEANTSCTLPSTYDYSFSLYVESGCLTSSSGTATLTFEVATESGSWVIYDTQYREVTFPHGPAYVTVDGTLNESGIPEEYTIYRISFSAALSNGAHAYGLTRTATICRTPPPTPCTLTFIDVPPDHTFYPFIRCLACRGIISGYDDSTFRAENSITRGQISKIVSNAAGFDDDPGPQIFEDVDPANPFYVWINRLSGRGYMGGYPCGTVPEEPCIAPDNRPYFRSGNSATRGQLSKIVSNSAGIGDPVVGYFYADVPEDHPFYLWIMRLTNLGVMSGYPCGGEGEPCDDQNRPYFRPYNEVTRGQASKIVANTFYPNCQTPVR